MSSYVEAGVERVVELPVVLELVASACCGDAIGKIDAERPAADIDLVGAVVERLARAPDLEPVPVVGLDVVLVRLTRCRALPEVPIERGGHGSGLPTPMDLRVLLYQALP